MYAIINVSQKPFSKLSCIGKSKSENIAWRIGLEYCNSCDGEDANMTIEEVKEQGYILLSDGDWLEIVKI